MPSYPNLLKQAFNTPLLLEPGYAGFFYAYLAQRVGAGRLQIGDELLDTAAMRAKAEAYSNDRSERKPYNLSQGIAVIPVMGTLINRGGYLSSYSGLSSYKSLLEVINQAENDPEVKGLFFEFDSPGGSVAGCFDLADALGQLTKPNAAFVDEQCCSAAFALASQLNTIYLPRTGVIGSVGVVWAHYDQSQMLENDGLTVTLVYSGAHKVDGNPYEALPDAVRADVQAELDTIRQLFAKTVARGRGISLAKVLATEAQVYQGQDAVKIGFADAVLSREQAFQTFLNSLSSTGMTYPRVNTMSDQTDQAARATVMVKTYTEDEAKQMAAQATSTERQRILGIIGAPQAQGRMDTAIKLIEAGLEKDAALAILETVPMQASTEPAPADMQAAVQEQVRQQVNSMALTMMADAKTIAHEAKGANHSTAKLIV